jgi:hypothetical protein
MTWVIPDTVSIVIAAGVAFIVSLIYDYVSR